MYPIQVEDSQLQSRSGLAFASRAARHGHRGAGSVPSGHVPFAGRQVDSYEGHTSWQNRRHSKPEGSYAHSSLWCRAVAFAAAHHAARSHAGATAVCPDCGGIGVLPNPEWNGRDRDGEFDGPECPRCAAEWDDVKGAEEHAFEQAWIGGDPARRAAL